MTAWNPMAGVQVPQVVGELHAGNTCQDTLHIPEAGFRHTIWKELQINSRRHSHNHLQRVPSRLYVRILPQECEACLDLVASMEWQPPACRGLPGWYVPERCFDQGMTKRTEKMDFDYEHAETWNRCNVLPSQLQYDVGARD